MTVNRKLQNDADNIEASDRNVDHGRMSFFGRHAHSKREKCCCYMLDPDTYQG